MKIYAVGGAVRDELLGLPVKDRDYVVVGSTPEQMIQLGYKPVGRDFPVFLHPQTHEEYALARTERKTARGYHGFEFHTAPDVTLEQDLARRDLTLNAIAKSAGGELIDPYGGAADLKAGVLRHVGPAFVEDPVRILRVARFAARFGFAIAPQTMDLMREMVERGEVDALVAERVWQELARGLMEVQPWRMLEVLHECGALARITPELDFLWAGGEDGSTRRALDAASAAQASLAVRVAILTRTLDPYAVDLWCNRLRVPAECRDLAVLAARHGNMILDAAALDAAALLALFDAADLWRKPARYEQLVEAALAGEKNTKAARARLQLARTAAAALDPGAIARGLGAGADIRGEIKRARLDAIQTALEA